MKKLFILVLLAFPFSSVFSFQVLVTKGKEYLKGKIESEGKESVVFVTNEGEKKTVPKNEIGLLVYKDFTEEEFQKFLLGLPSDVKPNQDSATTYLGRSRWDIIWRSAVVPGWGLVHAGETRKGIFAFSTFALFVGLEIQGHKDLEARRERYEESRDLFNAYSLGTANPDPVTLVTLQAQKEVQHLQYENAHYKSNVKLGLLFLKYFVQLGFANYYGKKWETGEIGQGFRLDIDRDYSTSAYSGSMDSNLFSQRVSLSYTFVF